MADRHLLTSAEAAYALRVGVSTIKRWTDEGELEAVRTAGGHRRYALAALHRFAALRKIEKTRLPPLDEPARTRAAIPQAAEMTLYDALASGNAAAISDLVTPRVDGVPRRAAFLDRVIGEALREIGYRWERGELSVDEEHRASHMISEALDELRPPAIGDAPLALLACPPDEWHELPLRLVRLLLEWSGWRTEFAGATLPWDAALAAVRRARPSFVALSARRPEFFQQPAFDRFVEACRRYNARVIVGGEWARGGKEEPEGYLRFRTLRGFERWLRVESRAD